ncbi:folylpolyglutamate synthase/dihydrofolate synthase family protein [Candidatus Albibeggiatoa sp. nov. NOAA]|uniref:bifunctional folylpolyglutamate synthase/dihydrofolate synthase n=1 Tax=Candidatus Albibeggiatoa sp. nov. NOAA TaxID=3162724 RepID=UPI0032FA6DAC|nr:bifunctional folylpolyglutamate synthase/dihydrofolate synthase [Thiotrichaceae bacterium]
MDVIEQYNQLNQKLENLVSDFKFIADVNLRLERISKLLELLGNPQDALSVIHVGGTSGKGSTSTFIDSLLQAQGYKTGLFLSPYLQILNETWKINSYPAKTSELLEIYNQIEPTFSAVAEQTDFGLPSFFEVKLAIALMLFKQHQVDVAIVEVGLGGKLDATNVLNSMISVLVSVGLDHTEILGDTVELIAADKVEIIKPHTTAICGFTQDSTRAIARTKANNVETELLLLDQDFSYNYEQNQFSIMTPSNAYQDLTLALQGQFQAHNAACAVMVYETFLKMQQKQPQADVVKTGLQRAFIAGRMEQIQSEPVVFLDGAHNPDKLGSFFARLKQMGQAITLVFALKMGKELNTDIFPLIRDLQAKQIIVTTFLDKGIWQAIPAQELKQLLIENGINSDEITMIEKPTAAIEHALNQANKDDVIAITGSLFLVGDCREYWYPKTKLLEDVESEY